MDLTDSHDVKLPSLLEVKVCKEDRPYQLSDPHALGSMA